MPKRIRTDYQTLLRKLADEGLLRDDESALAGRLYEHGEAQALGLMTHEILRRLLREGELVPRSGDALHAGPALVAADARRGCTYRLPDIVTPREPALRLPLNPLLGPPPSFTDAEIAGLFQDQSRRFLSSLEQAADVKGVVTGMLEVLRRVLGITAAISYTRTLPVPGVIARGLRQLRDHLHPHPLAPRPDPIDSSEEAFAARFVRAWQPYVDVAERSPAAALYVPDLQLLPEDRRPAPRGSALLIPLAERQPSWSAVLAALDDQAFAFDQERMARVRLFAPHIRRQLTHAILLQTVISHDFLTGIYNRAYFEDQLTRTLAGAARREQSFALMIVDIDDFKAFNTRHGYDAGDAVLRSVAQALGGALRSTDVLARYGGEEFVVLLNPPVSRPEALAIAQRLRSAVAQLRVEVPTMGDPDPDRHPQVPVTVSAGGAIFPEDGRSRAALWGCANAMLLAAKREGKNCVRFRDEITRRRAQRHPQGP